jgi:hypothetical protein
LGFARPLRATHHAAAPQTNQARLPTKKTHHKHNSCYAVQCVPGTVVDRYGEQLSRWDDCRGGAGKGKDPTTVIVKIVDACPCQHSNYASNQRWCCGDVPHIDLGAEAFDLLADKGRGVVRVRWRKVDCGKGNGAVAASSVV